MIRPPRLRGFGLRLLICLVLVGGVYGFQLIYHEHTRPDTPTVKKLAGVRASLDENYLRSTSLVQFTPSDAATDLALESLATQLNTAATTLQTAKTTAGNQLTPGQQKSIDGIVQIERQAVARYHAAHAVLGQIIAYDPADDLGGIDLNTGSATLTGRAAAAARGLQKASASIATVADGGSLSVGDENGPPPVVNSTTKQLLTSLESCFTSLSALIQPTALASQRQQCQNAYGPLRTQALSNLLNDSFNAAYAKQLQQMITPLLKQLDAQLPVVAKH